MIRYYYNFITEKLQSNLVRFSYQLEENIEINKELPISIIKDLVKNKNQYQIAIEITRIKDKIELCRLIYELYNNEIDLENYDFINDCEVNNSFLSQSLNDRFQFIIDGKSISCFIDFEDQTDEMLYRLKE